MELNDEMKALLRELGVALHRALTRDGQIKSITDQIKVNGFDIYLFMEANIALDRRDDNQEGELFLHSPEEHLDMEATLRFSGFDEGFLNSLSISSDE